MRNSIKPLIFAASVALLSVGCGRGESGSSVRMREVAVTDSGSLGAYDSTRSTQSGNCKSGEEVGMIYDAQAGAMFRDRVAAFVSATMDPSGLGEISGDPNAPTGIDLVMTVKVDGGGNVQAGSNLAMGIYDSFVGTKDQQGNLIEAYPVTIQDQVQGTVNPQTGDFRVQFADEYGAIQFIGKMDQTKIQGTVSFQNYKSFTGGAPSSGTLGSFVLPRCAVLQ